MNRVELANADRIVFASDFHLREGADAILATCQRFFESVGGSADALVLLGDIFDVWIGPKSARSSFAQAVFRSLAEVRRRGTRVLFIPGNRDFLLDDETARPHGVEVLSERVVVCAQGRRVLCLHGDQLCVRDESYRAATRILRSDLVRRIVSRLPSSISEFLADGYRDHSRRITKVKSRKAMDLCFDVVDRQFVDGVDGLVCGHVHEPRRYASTVKEESRDLLVLSTWNPSGTYGVLEQGNLRLVPFAEPNGTEKKGPKNEV